MTIHEELGYQLVALCKAHKRRAEAALRALGLYVGQELVLAELWKEEGISQIDLADRLQVEAPTVTKMLQRMEAGGLVRRRPDPVDARRSLVFLEPRGRALQPAVEEAWHRLDEAMVRGLRPEELLLLRRLLAHMRDNLEPG